MSHISQDLPTCLGHLTGTVVYNIGFTRGNTFPTTSGGFRFEGEWTCDCVGIPPKDKNTFSTPDVRPFSINGTINIDMWLSFGVCHKELFGPHWPDTPHWMWTGCEGGGAIASKSTKISSFAPITEAEFDFWGLPFKDCFKEAAGDDGILDLETELWRYLACANQYGGAGLDGHTIAWMALLKHWMDPELADSPLYDWLREDVDCKTQASGR